MFGRGSEYIYSNGIIISLDQHMGQGIQEWPK